MNRWMMSSVAVLLLAITASAQVSVDLSCPTYGEVYNIVIDVDAGTATTADGEVYDVEKNGDDITIKDWNQKGGTPTDIYLRDFNTEAVKGELDDELGPDLGTWKKLIP